MQEMLIDVLNATIDAYGNVAVQVTRCRNNTCPTHTENEYLVFAENSIQRSEWIMAVQVGVKLCSPQTGEVPFEDWILKNHKKIDNCIDNQKLEHPPGDFTCWS